jgi:hypothetical protein
MNRACRRVTAGPARPSTSSAGMPGPYPGRSRACRSVWPRARSWPERPPCWRRLSGSPAPRRPSWSVPAYGPIRCSRSGACRRRRRYAGCRAVPAATRWTGRRAAGCPAGAAGPAAGCTQWRPAARPCAERPGPRAELPLNGRELVAQHADLRVFVPAAHRQQREHVRHTEIGQSQQHGRSPCHNLPLSHERPPPAAIAHNIGLTHASVPTSMEEVSAGAGLAVPTGKNSSGSMPRHAARSHQSMSSRSRPRRAIAPV